MATIEFLGGEETGNVGRVPWGAYVFELNKAVECCDPHIIKKAMGNRFFRVDGDTSKAAAKSEKVAPDDTPTPDEEPEDDDFDPIGNDQFTAPVIVKRDSMVTIASSAEMPRSPLVQEWGEEIKRDTEAYSAEMAKIAAKAAEPVVKLDPLAKARAAKALKRSQGNAA